jgi:hypothetical protein
LDNTAAGQGISALYGKQNLVTEAEAVKEGLTVGTPEGIKQHYQEQVFNLFLQLKNLLQDLL